MESVWDYPRPPRLEDSVRHVRVVFQGVTIADSRCSKRVLETSHPPVLEGASDADIAEVAKILNEKG